MPEDQPISDDQAAVRDYMASKQFRRASRGRFGRNWTSLESLWGGAGVLMVWMILAPLILVLTISVLNEVRPGRLSFFQMALVTQTVGMPSLVVFSFAVATAMFWYPSVLLRIGLGTAMVVPGYVAFAIGIAIQEDGFDDDAFFEVGVCLFAQFMAAGTVALAMQFFSPWTLTHRRPDDADPIPPTGLRSLFELTIFFAIGFTGLTTVATGYLVEGLTFFGIWGTVSTVGIIAVMIGAMRIDTGTRVGWSVAFVFSFLSATMINGFFAIAEFSWQIKPLNLLSVAISSIYGTLLMTAILAMCIRTLKHFDWVCVNRRTQ